MSILQEYEAIRKKLGEERFSHIENFLAQNPQYLLSDVYYRESVWKEFEAWENSNVRPEGVAALNRGESAMVVSQEEIDQLPDRGERRLRSQAKEAKVDLASKISECEAIANEQKVSSKGSMKRDER